MMVRRNEGAGAALCLLAIAAFGQLPTEALKARGVHPNLTPLHNVKADFTRLQLNESKGVTAVMDNITNMVKLVNTVDEKGAAWARLHDRLNETGWMELHVKTGSTGHYSNDLRMYSAGLTEGILTAERMSQFYTNFYPLLQPDQDSTMAVMNIRNVFSHEIEHIMGKCGLNVGTEGGEPSDPFWKHVRYLFIQMWGVKDAYNLVAQEKKVRTMDMIDMFFINSHAELPELIQAYKPSAVKSRTAFQSPLLAKAKESFLQKASHAEARSLLPVSVGKAMVEPSPELLAELDRDWKLRLAKTGHCSALVRVTPNNKDLLAGHTTWSDYSKMTRVYKYYDFDLPLAFTANKVMSFSSYPGCVTSTDDFYALEKGLVVMDTSLEILNPEVYDRVPDFPNNPKIPKFIKVMSINRLAKTAAHWTSMYAETNYGTGNSQFLVVDYKLFVPEKPIRDNVVRIVEQVPGVTQQADVSTQLASRGYWGSFNRPFFKDTRELSGHAAAEATYGSFYSYESAPRAGLMGTVSANIVNLADMRKAMMRNEAADLVPGKIGGTGHAIAARLDLDPMVSNIPNGGIDAKVTNRCLMKSMQVQAISGPTHDAQPVFRWKSPSVDGVAGAELFSGWPHMGLPEVYDFHYMQMTPEDKEASDKLSDPEKC